MVHSYSTYEAKSRFSEIIRKVRAGERVLITYHGQEVAEIRPLEPPKDALDARVRELRQKGILAPSTSSRRRHGMLARRTGGLERFLESRED